MSKKDIKIFVSHRIDVDNVTIDNPLYVPVYCGAVYKDKSERNPDIIGDDTGNNISHEREKFNEFTVMYWVWKNQKADYYGFCQEERFISFSYKNWPIAVGDKQSVVEKNISDDNLKKYNLTDDYIMRREIEKSDVIVINPKDITKLNTPQGRKNNIKNYWLGFANEYIKEDAINKMLVCVEKICPKYIDVLREYLNSTESYVYNCFILKKELFEEMCEYVFSVLFELDKELDYKYYSEKQYRTVGYMGGILVGAYLYNLVRNPKLLVGRKQDIFFEDTLIKSSEIYKIYKDSIPIVMVCSNFYIPYLSVCLESLIEKSSKENSYDIIILEKDVREEDKKIIERMVACYENIKVRFYNAKAIVSDYSLFVASRKFAEEAYYRILVPWVLKGYDKAIVMDCDIIMQDDIANLYGVNVEKFLVAGVRDIIAQGMLNLNLDITYEYCKKTLKMSNPYDYVNTGVLVMNLKMFRKLFRLNELLEFASSNKFKLQEQDVLNIYIEGKVNFIEFAWNYYVESNKWAKKYLENAPLESRKEYLDCGKRIKLIHFACQPKPWNDPSVPLADKFWCYAIKSPYIATLIKRMSEITSDFRSIRMMLTDPNWSFKVGENLYSRFIFPFEAIPTGAKVVLYGGGVVGKIFMEQIAKSSCCQLVGICDKNPARTGIVEAPVISIKQLLGMNDSDYDVILIAIERVDVASEIRRELELAGIPAEKIKWVDPRR